jgi:hypothetical protein
MLMQAYAEARARIFGTSGSNGAAASNGSSGGGNAASNNSNNSNNRSHSEPCTPDSSPFVQTGRKQAGGINVSTLCFLMRLVNIAY